MKTTLPLTLALLLPLVGSAADKPEGMAKDDKTKKRLTYDADVLPLLKDKCVSCHNIDRKRGGLVLDNYTRLMAGGSSGASVKPGDPDGSLLYALMTHAKVPVMPPKQPKLAKESLEIVYNWIAAGAPENAGSKVIVPDRPKADFTLPKVARGKPAVPPMPPATLRLEPFVRAARDTAVTALAASPWAPLLAVGGQKQVLLYHADSLELLGVLPFPEGTPSVLKFSRNGSLLLAGGGRPGKAGKVVIWSVTRGERLFSVGNENDSVLAADISPDQSRVALGGPGKVVRIYNTLDGQLAHEVKKHTDWITTLEYSPDGVLLATGDRNGGLIVWEAFLAREMHTLKGHTAAVTEVSWRADSNVLGSASEDGTVRLFEMENGNQVRGWTAHPGGALALSYGIDGKLISAGRDRLARQWDGNGAAQRNYEALPDVALRAVFTHDGKRAVASDFTGQVVVWSTADGKRAGTLTANPPGVAQQLRQAQAALQERQRSHDALAAANTASQAALAKATAYLGAAQKALTDTAAALKTAEAAAARERAALTAAQSAAKNARDEVKAKETLSNALVDAVAKVKGEADKDKGNTAMATALTRAQALSGQAAAELTLAQKALADMTAAEKVVTPLAAKAEAALATARAAAQAAPKALAAAQAAHKAAQVKAAADKAAADAAVVELARARASVARWRAANAVAQKTTK